jgi:CRP/FNR family transcriptional regulator, anaerobic regulatory protein
MQYIKQLIKDFTPHITDEELADVISHFSVKKIKKEQYLLGKNKICKQLAIVKSGCLKVLYGESIVWFAFEQMPITEMQSFITQTKSAFTIQAIEDAEVFFIEYEYLQMLYAKYDNFNMFGMRFAEKMLAKTISRATSLQFDSAEIRYQNLMDNPNYLTRIPLQDLASYLGITPNSLSRIRNRISK